MNDFLKNYWLLTGEITVQPDPDAPDLFCTKVNALLITDESLLTEKEIGRASVALQMSYHNKNKQSTNALIKDVCILQITFLGTMSATDFHRKDEPLVNMNND